MKVARNILIVLVMVPLIVFDSITLALKFKIWDKCAGTIMDMMISIPMVWVKILVIAIFIGLAVWALRMPKSYAYKGADDSSWWRDVRWWAVIVIALEIIPYLFF